MPTRDEITAAIHGVTGNPDTGAVHVVTPALVDAIDRLCNGEAPETNTVKKTHQETRLMGGPENLRG